MTEKRYPACLLSTTVVPWTAEWQVDEAAFRRQVRGLLAGGVRHLYIFGTAGEGYAVTDEQFLTVTRLFSEEMRAGGAEPMVGVISLSLPTIIERINAAYALGVREFQISLTSWGALDGEETATFFAEVLGRFPDCRFLHYNLPRTKRLVTADEYAVLAERHPNLVATKNSTDALGRIGDLLRRAPQLQHFLNEVGFAHGSLIDECGLLASVALTNLQMGLRYFAAGQARDVAALMRMEEELAGMATALIRAVGGGRIDGAYDKVLVRAHDPEFPLRMLPPYAAAGPDAVTTYLDYVREHVPHWLPTA